MSEKRQETTGPIRASATSGDQVSDPNPWTCDAFLLDGMDLGWTLRDLMPDPKLGKSIMDDIDAGVNIERERWELALKTFHELKSPGCKCGFVQEHMVAYDQEQAEMRNE